MGFARSLGGFDCGVSIELARFQRITQEVLWELWGSSQDYAMPLEALSLEYLAVFFGAGATKRAETIGPQERDFASPCIIECP